MTLHVFTGVQVLNGALLQQSFVVEFMVHNQMCEDCHRVEAKDYWRSCVQVRQKVCTRCLTFLNGVNIHICIITIRIAHRANRWCCFYSKVEFSFFCLSGVTSCSESVGGDWRGGWVVAVLVCPRWQCKVSPPIHQMIRSVDITVTKRRTTSRLPSCGAQLGISSRFLHFGNYFWFCISTSNLTPLPKIKCTSTLSQMH